MARRQKRRLSSRSFRERSEISRGQDRRPRQEHARRLLLWLRDRCRRLAAVSQSRFRRGRRQALGSRTLLHRSRLLQRQKAHQALSGRYVLRFLSCGAEPEQPTRRPGTPQVGESELESRRPIFLGRSHLRVGRGRIELCISAVPHLSPRRARYLVCFHRLHEQPAHDEFPLQLRRADGVGEKMGQGRARGR